ncbi:hypothetical protein [Mycolicibacterium vulneris]|uniref:hypothetical protein n=1 Tax=Mycolicibacterium vulneris TaxID=547163 RepID=UPI0010550395|nr:hypothetical protein [Mycolicibacterium vulneris]
MSNSSLPRHLLELARKGSAPYPLTAIGRRARFDDCRDHPIDGGQIWRATWDDVALLVLVTGVEHAEIEAIPVTLDPGAEDAESVVLEPALTAFGVGVTLWVGLRTTLPFRVLDEIIDEIPNQIASWVTAATTDSRLPRPKGVQLGRPPETSFDSSVTIRTGVEDDLEALRATPALPIAKRPERVTRTLASILGRAVDLKVLVGALSRHGLSQSDVMSLLRGKRPLTPDLVDTITRVTGVEPALIAEAVQPLPVEFVEEVDHPRWRPIWRKRVHDEGLDEATARLRASYEMFALAARQTGSRTPDWSARLAQFRQSRSEPETS